MLKNFSTILAFAVCMVAASAQAQTFKMPCEVEGVIPALEDKKIPPERIEIEIQGLGKNIFMKTVGSKHYQAIVNSLTTEEYVGKNLTTEKQNLTLFRFYFHHYSNRSTWNFSYETPRNYGFSNPTDLLREIIDPV